MSTPKSGGVYYFPQTVYRQDQRQKIGSAALSKSQNHGYLGLKNQDQLGTDRS